MSSIRPELMAEGGPNGVSNFLDSLWQNPSPYLRIEALSCRIISVTIGMSIIHQGVGGGDVVSEQREEVRLNPLPIDLGRFNVT